MTIYGQWHLRDSGGCFCNRCHVNDVVPMHVRNWSTIVNCSTMNVLLPRKPVVIKQSISVKKQMNRQTTQIKNGHTYHRLFYWSHIVDGYPGWVKLFAITHSSGRQLLCNHLYFNHCCVSGNLSSDVTVHYSDGKTCYISITCSFPDATPATSSFRCINNGQVCYPNKLESYNVTAAPCNAHTLTIGMNGISKEIECHHGCDRKRLSLTVSVTGCDKPTKHDTGK